MIYFLQTYVKPSPIVKMGIDKGTKLEYMKHMKNWRHKTANSEGKSKANPTIILSAYF